MLKRFCSVRFEILNPLVFSVLLVITMLVLLCSVLICLVETLSLFHYHLFPYTVHALCKITLPISIITIQHL